MMLWGSLFLQGLGLTLSDFPACPSAVVSDIFLPSHLFPLPPCRWQVPALAPSASVTAVPLDCQ